MLPDNVLLQIFDFYRSNPYASSVFKYNPNTWEWHVLVHVCQTWRQVIFASPRRLHLRILCTHGTPVRKILAVWPPFPIVIDYHETNITPNDEENVIATLKHPDRVCFVRLDVTRSQWGRVATMMQEPFPVLKHLAIFSRDGSASVLPAGFLGGSAPCLQTFDLHDIPFPALPTLLLSTSDLVTLGLNIPPTGYISPEAMAASLAALPRLETFSIELQSAIPHPDRILLPRVTRTVLPALTSFDFTGTIEYLDDLITQIDGPRLKRIFVDCLNHFSDLQVAQISQFINRSVGPKLTPLRHAQVTFFSGGVTFNINGASYPALGQAPVYWQASHMARALGQFSATLSTVVHLELELDFHEDGQLEGMVDVEWLHLFLPIPQRADANQPASSVREVRHMRAGSLVAL
ncbi:hypothetical protein EDB89DRAFT_2072102 [Lactarius sanguifluus]|nr:hypothetical protein EDB89DRAFT_2072102 [Lactarius sanguifluus]